MSNYREAIETLTELAKELNWTKEKLSQLEAQSCLDAADARWEAVWQVFKILNEPCGGKWEDVVEWVLGDSYPRLNTYKMRSQPTIYRDSPEAPAGSPTAWFLNATHLISVLETLRNGRNAKDPDLMAEYIRLYAENLQLKEDLAAAKATIQADAKAIAAAIDWAVKGAKE